MTEPEKKIVRMTRKVAFDRFMVFAVKSGWKISAAKIKYLMNARVFDEAAGKFIPELKYFSCCTLRGGKSLKIVDEGNFERECGVAYSYRDTVGARDTEEVDAADVIRPAVRAKRGK